MGYADGIRRIDLIDSETFPQALQVEVQAGMHV